MHSGTTPLPGSVQIMGSGWNATINITPNISDCLNLTTPTFGNNVTYLSNCNGSDITVNVVKNGITSLNRAVVYSNINPNTLTPYSINLMDAAYGLQSAITYPTTLVFTKNDPTGQLSIANITAQYAYQSQPNYTYSIPLGALEYRANNNYWIPQTYYYQMGGVFLSQSDGITSNPPEITFANNGNGNITVNIVALAYDPADSGIIGGSSPAQISTSLKPDPGSLPYAPISLNTWNASINITTPDSNAAIMWAAYLNAAANQTGGIPTTYYTTGNTTTGSYIYLKGGTDDNPHITLTGKTANLSVNVQSVGST